MYQKLLRQFYPTKTLEITKAAAGYGMAMLLVFLSSSILIAASTSLLLAPGSSNSMGALSQDQSTAKQLAEIALDAAQTDILSQQSSGTTITTSYRYPASGSTTVYAPTYPGSGANVAKGSYYVTTTYARGYTFLLQANVTVGSSNVAVPRLVQLNDPPSIYANAFVIYSLRKVNSTYTGYAARVRCASTSTTTDIGFTASGDFDLSSFRTCLGDSALPLDAVSGAQAAYGLRKLRSGYSGFAVKVRRSSDNTTQDIGFDANGNLDTTSLKSFIGVGNAYIDTWYDQSTNGYNLTQSTLSKQPRIASSGVIDKQNTTPSVYFGGSQSLSNTAVAGAISGSELRSFLVAEYESSTDTWGHFATLFKTGDTHDYSTTTSAELLAMGGTTTKVYYTTNNNSIQAGSLSASKVYQFTSYHDASNNQKLYCNGTQTSSSSKASSLSVNSIILGTGGADDNTAYITGYISEFILYTSNLSVSDQQKIERSQGHYYSVSGMQDGFVTTWYDQSGHGYDVSQATTANQPTIDQAGSKPAVLFNKLNTTYMDMSGLNITLSPATFTAFGVGQIMIRGGGLDNDHQSGQMLAVYKTGTSSDRSSDSEAILMQTDKTMSNMKDSDNLQTTANSLAFNQDMQMTTVTNGTTRVIRQYQTTSGLYTNSTVNKATQGVTINTLRIAANDGLNSNALWDGRINELVLKNTAMTSTDYQNVETDERSYYGL